MRQAAGGAAHPHGSSEHGVYPVLQPTVRRSLSHSAVTDSLHRPVGYSDTQKGNAIRPTVAIFSAESQSQREVDGPKLAPSRAHGSNPVRGGDGLVLSVPALPAVLHASHASGRRVRVVRSHPVRVWVRRSITCTCRTCRSGSALGSTPARWTCCRIPVRSGEE